MLTQSMAKVAAAAWVATVVGFVALLAGQTPSAQQAPAAGAAPAPAQGVRGRGPAPTDTLGAGPWDLPAGRGRIHVTAIKGLDHPWGIAFATDGSMLVTERPGRLRVIRNGTVDPAPIGPMPQSLAVGLGGALDVTLDPQFSANRRIYIAYAKPGTGGGNDATTAVYRAKWDGGSTLTEGKDIWVADAY
ncbi:MAG TPA: PQQ-dependent sugar dehydrogenase, partial [Pseudolysinimonas sp.]|nr:PQQ-dependent sugar dehydrogenase [Pseudolysinimonas sp.]